MRLASRCTIGRREANRHLAQHIKAVDEGYEVIITRRGRPVARLTADVRTKDPATLAGRLRAHAAPDGDGDGGGR